MVDGLGSIPRLSVIFGLSLMVLFLAPRVFASHQKSTCWHRVMNNLSSNSRDGVVVFALASHQCGPDSIPDS